MRRLGLFAVLLTLYAGPAKACGLALALLVDISGSVDPREYRIQIDGLAAALRDGTVADALIRQNAAVTLIQWTGASRQEISLGWTRIDNSDALERFARQVEAVERPWAMFATAIGEALSIAETALSAAPDCDRQVIDVSGDGASNEGIDPGEVRDRLAANGVTINALVITGSEPNLLAYFENEVIGGANAFAIAANGYGEYPERIRRKLIRETASAVSQMIPGAESPIPMDARGQRRHPAHAVITSCKFVITIADFPCHRANSPRP
ncbi:MAG: DUF1194 domain-containing protein [Pseudomonadota bacterium]